MQHSVFISGAAQGIGAEIARIFHRHGYKVGIYDIRTYALTCKFLQKGRD